MMRVEDNDRHGDDGARRRRPNRCGDVMVAYLVVAFEPFHRTRYSPLVVSHDAADRPDRHAASRPFLGPASSALL
jgi:hypothetical protein